MVNKINHRAASMLEYVILLSLAVAALTTMQLYFRRSIQAAVKLAADQLGSQKRGAAEGTYWVVINETPLNSTTNSTVDTTKFTGGRFFYDYNQTSTKEPGNISVQFGAD